MKSFPYDVRGARQTEKDSIQKLADTISSYQRIKERKIEELEKRAAFRREFIADISHELKTPLFAAQGFVHTLLDGAVRDKAVREKFLKKAAKNLDGLDMLVQDLLSLSQIETGNMKVHLEYFDLHELIQDVFEQFESRSQKKDIQLKLFLGKEKKMQSHRTIVYADSRLINQVISNLVSNAIKYSSTKGVVEVTLAEDDLEVEVVVKDQGIGIPQKHLPRIFERFYRVEKSRSKIKDKGGTGLGLAIVKHILEAHDSKIAVQSKFGEGSVFSFKIRKDPRRTVSNN